MNGSSKIITALITGLLFFACNNKKEVSAYDDILTQQPFAPLTDSIKQDPQQDELWFRRAVLLNKNNHPGPALADFRQAWSLKKDERYALGVSTLLLLKQPDSAIVFLKSALEIFPGYKDLELSLARAYDAKGDANEALRITNRLLFYLPNQPDVLKMQGDLYDKLGNSDSAAIVLEKAYSFLPYDVDLNYALAFHYAQNKNPRVIALCDSLVKADLENRHAEPFYYKGIYYSNINDKSKAIDMFDQAIQRDYQFLNAYIEKGNVLYDLKKYSDALKTFTLANTISPKFPDAWYWMGRCQEAMGLKDEARLNYLKAYGLDPSFIEAKEAADRLVN